MQPGDDARLVFQSTLAEACHLLQLGRENLVLLPYHITIAVFTDIIIHDDFLSICGKTVLVAGIKIVAIAPVVCKVWQPCLADESGLAAEELSVGDLVACGDDLTPLPRILFSITSPPIIR